MEFHDAIMDFPSGRSILGANAQTYLFLSWLLGTLGCTTIDRQAAVDQVQNPSIACWLPYTSLTRAGHASDDIFSQDII